MIDDLIPKHFSLVISQSLLFLLQGSLSTYSDSSYATPDWVLMGKKWKQIGVYCWWFGLSHHNI